MAWNDKRERGSVSSLRAAFLLLIRKSDAIPVSLKTITF